MLRRIRSIVLPDEASVQILDVDPAGHGRKLHLQLGKVPEGDTRPSH